MDEIITGAAVPVITSLVGFIVVWLQEWRRGRDAHVQRANLRSEAARLVVFYKRWIETQKLVCSPEEYEAAQLHVQDRLDRLADVIHAPEEIRSEHESGVSLRRLLLLDHPAHSRTTKIARAAFHVLLVLGVIILAGSLVPYEDGTYDTFSNVLVYNMFMIAMIVIARTVAVAFDDHDHQRHMARLKAEAPLMSHHHAPMDRSVGRTPEREPARTRA